MNNSLEIMCIECHRTPDELSEYDPAVRDQEELSNIEYVQREEGTYNPNNGHFVCTECYIAIGMPTSPQGWIAP